MPKPAILQTASGYDGIGVGLDVSQRVASYHLSDI
jgi:hypothetical protein